MLLIIYFLIAVAVFTTFFVVLYFLSNPFDRSSSIINYPYVVAVKPMTIAPDASVVISMSSLLKNLSGNITLYVIDPHGMEHDLKLENMPHSVKFPDDFTGKKQLEMGQYSVLLSPNINNQNSSISPLHFDVVFQPLLASFNGFSFGVGLPVTIALLLTVITTVYEYASTKKGDNQRKLVDKSKWTLEKSTFYMDLVAQAWKICELFDFNDNDGTISFKGSAKQDYNSLRREDDKNRFMYYLICFYNSYQNFTKNINAYYFDDVLSEDILSKLDDKILSLYTLLIGDDVNVLKQFTNLELYELKSNNGFIKYRDNACDNLKENGQVDNESLQKLFYFYHLVYSRVLYTSVNDAFMITYSSPALLHTSLTNEILDEGNLLTSALKYVNTKLYKGNRKRYYRFTIGGKEVKHPRQPMRKLSIELILIYILAAMGISLLIHVIGIW